MKSLAELIDSLPTYERNVEERKSEGNDNGNEITNHRCYCCFDTGQIAEHLAKLIIPDYKYGRSGDYVACHRTSECHRPWHTLQDKVQNNISPATCETLHQISLQHFKSFSEQEAKKQAQIVDVFAKSI
jgi:hypothetical protein